MPEQLSPHLVGHVVLGPLKDLAQSGIEVFPITFEGEEPVQVVGAAAGVGDLLLGYLQPGGDFLQGGLYPVAQADEGDIRDLSHRQTVGGHGVGILQHDGAWFGQLLHVAGDVDQHRYGAQSPKDAARSHGVADTLIHAVFQRYLVVDAKGVHPANLDHDDDEVGVFDGLPAVKGGPHLPFDSVVLEHALAERFHPLQLGPGPAHQRELAAGQRRRGHDVAHQQLAENDASRTDHDDLLAHNLASLYSICLPSMEEDAHGSSPRSR